MAIVAGRIFCPAIRKTGLRPSVWHKSSVASEYLSRASQETCVHRDHANVSFNAMSRFSVCTLCLRRRCPSTSSSHRVLQQRHHTRPRKPREESVKSEHTIRIGGDRCDFPGTEKS